MRDVPSPAIHLVRVAMIADVAETRCRGFRSLGTARNQEGGQQENDHERHADDDFSTFVLPLPSRELSERRRTPRAAPGKSPTPLRSPRAYRASDRTSGF